MIEGIAGPGRERIDQVPPGRGAKANEPEGVTGSAKGRDAAEVVVSSELRELISRVKQADVLRKDRVHQVLEKLQRGELVTSETVREAAENLLRSGA